MSANALATTSVAASPREWLAELFRAHHRSVWSVAARLGVEQEAVDDVVQEVFLVAHRRRESFQERGSERSWLIGIARRVAFRHRRARSRLRRRLELLARTASPGSRARAAEAVEARAALAQVETLLEKLPAEQRALFILCELEGLTGPEAAQRVGIPTNTAYSRLRLARAALQACLQTEGLDPKDVLPRASAACRAPEGAQRRAWALLVVRLPEATTGGAAMAVTKAATIGKVAAVAKAAAAPALATVAGVTLYAADRPPWSAPPDVPVTTIVERADPQIAPSAVARAATRGPDPGTSPLTGAAPEAAPVAPPTSLPEQKTASRSGPRPAEDPSTSPAAVELQLLSAARKALARGDETAALASLEEHRRRFPTGKFAVERDAERVVALCSAGSRSQGRGEAHLFLRAHQQSVHRQRIEAACGAVDAGE